MPNQRQNWCNANFPVAVEMLRSLHPDVKFELKNIYLDYGAGMKWDTIVAYPPTSLSGSYQMLTPRDWDELYMADGIAEVTRFVINLSARQANLLHPSR